MICQVYKKNNLRDGPIASALQNRPLVKQGLWFVVNVSKVYIDQFFNDLLAY